MSMPRLRPVARALAALAAVVAACGVHAQQQVVNLYSARHYSTDQALYDNFTKETGIVVRRIDGREDELVERIRSEGAASPADILITVDASRLDAADRLGLFQPVQSPALQARVPANLRTPNWLAFSTRARVIVFDKARLDRASVQTYESLADPKLKGQVCVRSGAHPYNLSLGAAMISHVGEAATEQWAKGLVANFARAPKGGDTDQIKAVASGECGVALVNSYYLARVLRSRDAADQKTTAAIGIVWPNQATWGAHVNVSGAGVLKTAPNKANAVRFLEYLASDQAQVYFADGNNEWPVVATVKAQNPALDAMGSWKADATPIEKWSPLTAEAQKVFDRAGWR